MKLLGDKTSLVLAGAWNPAILSPTWIGRHILKLPPGNVFQVGMQLPVQGFGGGPPRLTFEGLSITPDSDALIFHLTPEDGGRIVKSIDAAKRILDTLPHTPIAAMGFNFEYEVDQAEGQLGKTVAWADDVGELIAEDADAKVVSRNWTLGVSAMGHLVNLSYQANAAGATITVNHHYEVEGSAERAAKILTDETLFDTLMRVTNRLVDGIIKGGGQ